MSKQLNLASSFIFLRKEIKKIILGLQPGHASRPAESQKSREVVAVTVLYRQCVIFCVEFQLEIGIRQNSLHGTACIFISITLVACVPMSFSTDGVSHPNSKLDIQ